MNRLLLALTLMSASFLVDLNQIATAQVATPEAIVSPQLDLAAMALDSTAMPEGFALTAELYIPGNRLSELYTGGLITQTEIDNTRLLWFYESHYTSLDGTRRIRSYVEEYPDANAATSGFAILEDEVRLNSIDAVSVDEPGIGVGEAPSEVSRSTIPQGADAPPMESLDATFRLGNLVAGVAVETFDGAEPDRQLIADLANVLAKRIAAVEATDPLPMIIPELPLIVLPLSSTWQPGQEGYVSAAEAFGDEGGNLVEASFESGYLRSAGAGSPLPFISIHMEQFSDESGPLSTLSKPEIFQPPFTGFEEVALSRIDGTSAAIGYYYANPLTDSTVIDSARIVMVVDTSLVTIDVQGSATSESAMELAVILAAAQAQCMESGLPCTMPELPEELLVPAIQATPTA